MTTMHPAAIVFRDPEALRARCDIGGVRRLHDVPGYENGAVVPAGDWSRSPGTTPSASRRVSSPRTAAWSSSSASPRPSPTSTPSPRWSASSLTRCSSPSARPTTRPANRSPTGCRRAACGPACTSTTTRTCPTRTATAPVGGSASTSAPAVATSCSRTPTSSPSAVPSMTVTRPTTPTPATCECSSPCADRSSCCASASTRGGLARPDRRVAVRRVHGRPGAAVAHRLLARPLGARPLRPAHLTAPRSLSVQATPEGAGVPGAVAQLGA